jgi:L-arabinonolactonase
MADVTAHLLVDCRNKLGEGIQWHAGHQRVYWTDIYGDTLYSCDEDGSNLNHMPLEAGLTAFAFTESGRILAAFADGVCWLDPETGKRRMHHPYKPDLPTTRMNDGNLDRQGRFVVGGMDEAEKAPLTPVWSVTRDGTREIIEGIGCANSTAFSPDGATMYFTDSADRDIFAYDYDTATGTPSNRRIFTTLAPEEGTPDGSAVDAEGALWNARYRGAAVQRYLPDGIPDMQVGVPVPNITCCAFGGRNLDRLFITTARDGMSDAELASYPNAGSLFYAELPVRGLEHGYFR